jgi:5-methylcytosine-specific restriction enzyme subunit McrC
MRTDIEIVIDKDTKILIDAKYYKNALSSRYEINKFISNNMYQINTYLEHNLNYKNLRGILLYPSVGYYFDEKYIRKDKYTIEFRTIDLNMDWIHIEKQLLNTLF